MPTVVRAFPILPAFVFVWMMMRAGLVFTPDAGRRDARGLGIALSMWGTLGATRLAATPPLWVQLSGAAGSWGHWRCTNVLRGRYADGCFRSPAIMTCHSSCIGPARTRTYGIPFI